LNSLRKLAAMALSASARRFAISAQTRLFFELATSNPGQLFTSAMSRLEILPADDSALVRRMLAGDEFAFRAFFDTYFRRVYRFALPRLGGNVESTHEVVQSTLSKAIRNIEKYRGDAALFSWLCQICRHEIVDYLRAHKRYSERVVLIDDSAELQAAMETVHAPPTDDPAHCYSTAEARHLIQAILDRLPPRYGDILEWKYIEGRSVEEIGERLGVGHTAAQSLLARARQAFREGLETVFGSTAQDILAGMLSGK
jgi:RNA polymerase sigma-70 factor (ECF subfamily)